MNIIELLEELNKISFYICITLNLPTSQIFKKRKKQLLPFADLFDKVTWHDGTKLSVADFLMTMIMTFDRANKDSKIYDDAALPNFQSSAGLRSLPDHLHQPADDRVLSEFLFRRCRTGCDHLVPMVSYGEGSWHVLAVANLAEAAGQLAYSDDKATAKKIEWTNFVGGPSLDILSGYLDEAITTKLIPYAHPEQVHYAR